MLPLPLSTAPPDAPRLGGRVAIVSLCAYDANVTGLASWSMSSRVRYARRHGYQLFLHTQVTDSHHHPAWSKVGISDVCGTVLCLSSRVTLPRSCL